ncbi:MAG: CHASE2 domain-containing protein [Candidatus Paceibacterota bacterium]
MKNLFPASSILSKSSAGYAVCFVLLTAFSIGIAISSRGQDITNTFYDPIRKTTQRPEVAVIGVDDKSLQEFGAWPWDRSIFADLATTLSDAGVKVAVYDILFLEPRSGDEALKESLLQSTTTTILASKLEGETYLSSYLLTTTTENAVSALANVAPDTDGKVRGYPSSFTIEGTCVHPLSLQAFNLYTKKIESCTKTHSLFRYPSAIATYSLSDVIQGVVPKEKLQGKVVFIGSTSLDLEDHFVGMGGSKVPGVFVHASAFTSLLNNVDDRPVSRGIGVMLLILVSLCAVASILIPRALYKQVLTLLAFLVGLVIVSALLFEKGIILPLPWLLETSIVSAGFVTLVRFMHERKKNEQIASIFSKYVHKDVLAELLHSGQELKLGGERKQMSILFSDIRGFTTLSETLSPEELTSTLNEYLSAMTPHILEEKGTIDKFIGDAIMAFWNAPLDVPNHPVHAVKSALLMHTAMKQFNEERGTTLAIGIGVHTGNVIVGNVGGKDRVNYTVLGDAVNLASRIEGLTKKYGVATIVTKAVKDLVDDPQIAFRCLDVITVAGKSLPTTLYEPRYAEDFPDGLIADYEKAFKYYYDKEWNKAETIFKKLAKAGDVPSEKMLARIPELRKRTDWDGVWRFDEK